MASGSFGGAAPGDPAALWQDDPLIGRVLDGRYRIEAVLGTGGVGVVYRGEHTALRRPVAIKVLHNHFGDDEDVRARFRREAKALSALSHPNVVAINDYGIADGMPYLTMELLEGCTLEDLLHQQGTPEPEIALEITRSMLRGMSFAHARGVLHRDLKPGNVFLQSLPDDPYHVKLLDFGLAKIVGTEDSDGEPTLTGMGTILGTPAYMSPEQAAGSRVDMRTDVYSAGVVLFEMLCGRPPFVAPTRPEVMRAHIVEPVPRLGEARPGLEASGELERFLARALAKEPGDRYVDSAEMLAALDELPRPAARVVAVLDSTDAAGVDGVDPTERATVPAGEPGRVGNGGGWAPPAATRPAPTQRKLPWVLLASGLVGILVAAAVVGVVVAWATAPEQGTGTATGPAEPAPPRAPGGAEGAAADDGRGRAADEPSQLPAGAEPADGAHLTSAEADSAADGTDDADASEPAADSADVPPKDRPPAANLLARRMPTLLRRYHAGIRRGRKLDRRHERKLREYQRTHANDPRPSLLLAHDYVNKQWFSDALARYRTAYEIDARSRGDPRMLRDLIRIVSSKRAGSNAAEAIEHIYGAEALPLIDRALEKDLQEGAAERLQALRERLAG